MRGVYGVKMKEPVIEGAEEFFSDKEQLLQEIAYRCGAGKIEELKKMPFFSVFEVLEDDFLDRYPVKIWNEVLGFICGEELHCRSMEEIRECLAFRSLAFGCGRKYRGRKRLRPIKL